MLKNNSIKFLKLASKLNIITSTFIIIGIGSLIYKGLQPSLDFTGGLSTHILLEGEFTEQDIRKSLGEISSADMQVLQITNPKNVNKSQKEFLIETQYQDEKAIITTLEELVGQDNITIKDFMFQEPHIGKELAYKTLYAFLIAIVIIGIYIAIRFDRHYAAGSLIALLHDVLFTMGILSLLNIQLSITIVAALLTIIGYSLNDTIIIYDRIRENMQKLNTDREQIINLSLNQILSRTLITSLTTLFVVMVLYFFGGDILEPFALTLIIGVIIGTYSSIFVASPIMMYLEKAFPIKELDEEELLKN